MSRTLWFTVGAGAGVYALTRARRAAEALTPDGLGDRLAGLYVGARLFREELMAGMAEKENELRSRLDLGLDGQTNGLQLSAGQSLALTRKGKD
jgi:Family of unknown function (DUF6167)